MGYSSPFGKSSIFIPDDSEFYHGPAIVNVGKVIRDLVSYSQSSSKLYFLRSNFLVVSNSERYRVYDGEQWRDLNIHAEISNLEGNVDINANSAVLRADAPDFGGDGTVYKLYIPFAEQNGTGGEIEYAFCVYSTDLYDFLWFIDMVFEGVRETVFRHLWNFAKRDMERTGGDERKVAQWYQNNSPWILVGISEEERIKHLSIIINSKRAVNTVGTNEEKAVLNLLDSFKPAYNNDTNIAKSLKELESTPATKLLKALLRANGGGDILFERLYSRMNNFFGAKNFTKCIQVLFMLWENSIFLLPDNALYNGNTAPDNIPYSSEKKLGFYTSNFKLTRSKEKIDVKQKKLVTVPQQLPDMPETKGVVFEDFATYHIYQPILPIEPERQRLKDGEQGNAQKSEIPVPKFVIPAFYLLAVEDQNFWANFQFGVQIGIEIITTISGVGNLFKLRHLRHLSKLEGVVVSMGAIQVVSGTVGVMLNFVDENDAKYGPFCDKLRNVLIWIDLASLGADAIASKLLKDAAKEALEESRKLKLVLEEEAERATKEAEKAAEIAKDEAEIEKIQNELKKIAGEEKLIIVSNPFDELGGKYLKKRDLKTLKLFLKEKYGVELRFIDKELAYQKLPAIRNGQKTWIRSSELFEDWKSRKVFGKFDEGPPPMIILRQGQASELTVFHEMVHMEVWYKKLPKMHIAEEETYVFEQIFKAKDNMSWTDAELIDALTYVNRIRGKYGLEKIVNPYIEQLKWKSFYR
ncbi:MAG TPA: hypothetical protein PLW44_01215 [Chitinophagales bacterium]|nr:hypothetical protein [Chitinophagales bacterium]